MCILIFSVSEATLVVTYSQVWLGLLLYFRSRNMPIKFTWSKTDDEYFWERPENSGRREQSVQTDAEGGLSLI